MVSYTTVSPLPRRSRATPVGGLLSVALSSGFPRPGVTRHPRPVVSRLSSTLARRGCLIGIKSLLDAGSHGHEDHAAGHLVAVAVMRELDGERERPRRRRHQQRTPDAGLHQARGHPLGSGHHLDIASVLGKPRRPAPASRVRRRAPTAAPPPPAAPPARRPARSAREARPPPAPTTAATPAAPSPRQLRPDLVTPLLPRIRDRRLDAQGQHRQRRADGRVRSSFGSISGRACSSGTGSRNSATAPASTLGSSHSFSHACAATGCGA